MSGVGQVLYSSVYLIFYENSNNTINKTGHLWVKLNHFLKALRTGQFFDTKCNTGKCWTVNYDAVGSLGWFHLCLKTPPHLFVDLKLPSWRIVFWPWENFLSTHFHLPEIQQSTKYLWCFNPTCQCAGAFAFICSVILSTSGGLPSLNLCGSTLDPPCMFKLLQETELLDLFIQLPRLRRDIQCLQPWPATRW